MKNEYFQYSLLYWLLWLAFILCSCILFDSPFPLLLLVPAFCGKTYLKDGDGK